jgi:triacylglycerol lipase
MRRLLALKDLVHDYIERTTNLVQETHESVAEKQVRLLSAAPESLAGDFAASLGELAGAVNEAHLLTAGAVYDAIRATNHGVRLMQDAGVALARSAVEAAGVLPRVESALTPRQAEAIERIGGLADLAQGVLNAVVGDFLDERENGLGIQTTFYADGRPLPLDGTSLAGAISDPTEKVCIFVHGLGVTELAWSLFAQKMHGDASTNFGTLLRRDLGYTPIFVRYNTGLHVSRNGRRLAERIGELLRDYPVDVRKIVLVGHSMGGLVARSAAHYGKETGEAWVSRLSHVFTIGSPHLGAPLEKAGNVLTSILGFFDTPGTQVPAKVFNARSAGIKDLRFGYVVDEDWKGRAPDAFLEDNRTDVPFVDAVTYGFIASTLTRDPAHPVGQLLGDVLVRVGSATGHHAEESRRIPFHVGRVLSGAHHLELVNHPEVYAELLRCLATSLPSRLEGVAPEREPL